MTSAGIIDIIGQSIAGNSKSGNLVLPEKVYDGDTPFTLIGIGDYAFTKCYYLTSITIPNSVTTIGEFAFDGCTKLVSIYNYADTPQDISSEVFTGVDKTACTLYVPEKNIDAYKKADGWKEFVIKAIPFPEPDGDNMDFNIHYYDINGNKTHSKPVTITLPTPEYFPGYIFSKWVVLDSDLEDGIHIQAIYKKDISTSISDIETNSSSTDRAQKIIRNGQVYILKNNKVYTITGVEVK